MNKRPEDLLEESIVQGTPSGDAAINEMADTAETLRSALAVEAPDASEVQTMFVEGIASSAPRALFPRMARGIAVAAVLLLVLVLAGRRALPGHTLYSVRQALTSVGLAESAAREAARRLQNARDLVVEAETLDPGGRAQALAVEAIGELGVVRELAEDIDEVEAEALLGRAAALERRAARVIAALDLSDGDEALRSNGDGSDKSGDGSLDEDRGSQGSGDDGSRGDDADGGDDATVDGGDEDGSNGEDGDGSDGADDGRDGGDGKDGSDDGPDDTSKDEDRSDLDSGDENDDATGEKDEIDPSGGSGDDEADDPEEDD